VGVRHQELSCKRQNPSLVRVPPFCTQVQRGWPLTTQHYTHKPLTTSYNHITKHNHKPTPKYTTKKLFNFDMPSTNGMSLIYLLILLILTYSTLTHAQTPLPPSLLIVSHIQVASPTQTGHQAPPPNTSSKSKVCSTLSYTHTLTTTYTYNLTHTLAYYTHTHCTLNQHINTPPHQHNTPPTLTSFCTQTAQAQAGNQALPPSTSAKGKVCQLATCTHTHTHTHTHTY
jgi:hypothetical protein